MGLFSTFTNAFKKPAFSFAYLEEKAKSQVINPDTGSLKITSKVGIDHPFDFKLAENCFAKDGLINAAVNKYVDFIVGAGITIDGENDNSREVEVLSQFIADTDFDNFLRDWVKQGLITNGFAEIVKNAKGIEELKIVDAKTMYVKRDKHGKVEGYSQVIGNLARDEVIAFKPEEIAHLPLNRLGNDAYGLGIVYPILGVLENIKCSETELHSLMKRKSNNPWFFLVGNEKEGIPSSSDLQSLQNSLQYLNNKQEWILPYTVQPTQIDTGNFGDKFEKILNHDLDMFFFSTQIPAVLMGKGNVPEGLAGVQMDAFERRITSLQQEVEHVLREQIFSVVLQSNGLGGEYKIIWKQLSAAERRAELQTKLSFLGNMGLNPKLKEQLELQSAKEFGINPELIEMPELAKMREQELRQPRVPGANKSMEALNDVNEIKEWLGFNYKEYVASIILAIDKHEFSDVKAVTPVEEQAGYLTNYQVEKLKSVLEKGFVEGQSLKQISFNIEKKVAPKNLLALTESGELKLNESQQPILRISAEERPMMIARTEVTRMANLGAVEQFKKEGATRVQWVASLGDRTCPQCQALDGQSFPINNHPEIPAHTNCRCSLIMPLTE